MGSNPTPSAKKSIACAASGSPFLAREKRQKREQKRSESAQNPAQLLPACSARYGQFSLNFGNQEEESRHALGQDVAALDSGGVGVQGPVGAMDRADHTPPAACNNFPPRAWLDALRHLRPAGVATVAVAREIAADPRVSNRELAGRTGHTEYTCQRAKRRLVALGFLRVVKSRGGPGNRNSYAMTVPGGAP